MSTRGPLASCRAPVVRILVRLWRAVEPVLKEIEHLKKEKRTQRFLEEAPIFTAYWQGKK